jgi:hypothetical protein
VHLHSGAIMAGPRPKNSKCLRINIMPMYNIQSICDGAFGIQNPLPAGALGALAGRVRPCCHLIRYCFGVSVQRDGGALPVISRCQHRKDRSSRPAARAPTAGASAKPVNLPPWALKGSPNGPFVPRPQRRRRPGAGLRPHHAARRQSMAARANSGWPHNGCVGVRPMRAVAVTVRGPSR